MARRTREKIKNMKHEQKVLYFAYGSNMSAERLQARIPSARFVTTAKLPSHRLTFHKKGVDNSAKCDVVASDDPTDFVYGAVFEFLASEKSLLDKIEGVRYRDALFDLMTDAGETLQALLYYVADKAAHTDPGLKPYHWYREHVVFGARQAGLPQDYIDQLATVKSIDDPDNQRHERELEIYRVAGIGDQSLN